MLSIVPENAYKNSWPREIYLHRKNSLQNSLMARWWHVRGTFARVVLTGTQINPFVLYLGAITHIAHLAAEMNFTPDSHLCTHTKVILIIREPTVVKNLTKFKCNPPVPICVHFSSVNSSWSKTLQNYLSKFQQNLGLKYQKIKQLKVWILAARPEAIQKIIQKNPFAQRYGTLTNKTVFLRLKKFSFDLARLLRYLFKDWALSWTWHVTTEDGIHIKSSSKHGDFWYSLRGSNPTPPSE